MTILLVIAALLLAAVLCFRAKVFYYDATGQPTDAWRLLWMAPFSATGLAWRGWKWRRFGLELALGGREPVESPDLPPLFSYLVYYPVIIALGDVLAFAAMHSFLSLGSWLFYPVSAIFAFTLARAPGRWENLLTTFRIGTTASR